MKHLALIAVCVFALWSNSYAASECVDSLNTEERIAQLFKTLDRLTRIQRSQGAEINEFISRIAEKRNWSTLKEYELRQQFLSSDAYSTLQAKRRPNDLVLDKTKRLLRNKLGEAAAQLSCQDAEEANNAAKRSFVINEEELKAAERFFSSVE